MMAPSLARKSIKTHDLYIYFPQYRTQDAVLHVLVMSTIAMCAQYSFAFDE